MLVEGLRPGGRGKQVVIGRAASGLFAVGPVFNDTTLGILKVQIEHLGYTVVQDGPLYSLAEFQQEALPVGVKHCHHASTGVVVWRKNGPEWEALLIKRRKYPFGWAPPAGHLDGDEPIECAVKEVKEEVGLALDPDLLTLDFQGWMPDHCRRTPTSALPGHAWSVYAAQAPEGQDITLADDEAADAQWANMSVLSSLAAFTVAYAAGEVSTEKFRKLLGLEPAWVLLGQQLGWWPLTPSALSDVARLAAQPAPREA